MKKKYLLLLVIANQSFSQDVMDIITNETCECIKAKNIDLEKIESSELQMQLGLCVIQSYSNHKDKLPKSKRILLDNEDQMEKFGEEIGMKMITFCPDILLAIGKNEIDKNESNEVLDVSSLSSTGILIERKKDGFLTIKIKEESGRINDFILIKNFDNAYLISDDVLKVNTKVKVDFYYEDIYDLKLNKFISSKVLLDIQKI
jgi:hypothetical protein